MLKEGQFPFYATDNSIQRIGKMDRFVMLARPIDRLDTLCLIEYNHGSGVKVIEKMVASSNTVC